MDANATPDGLLVVDKPGGMTSHDVVARVRHLLHTRKVGHAGTLDPMATGVLLVGVGRATKLLTYLVGAGKTYEATVRLGAATVTDDAESPAVSVAGPGAVAALAPADVERALAGLRGDILQVPSSVSAIKIGGRRAYARVRGGETVDLPARPVTVSRLEVTATRRVDDARIALAGPGADGPDETARPAGNAEPDGSERTTGRSGDAADTAEASYPALDLDVVVDCSSGTYVRALARDLGRSLGVGGHLIALRRTRVGRFPVAGAWPLPGRDAPVDAGDVPLVPLARAAAEVLPVRRVDAAEARELGFGRPVAATGRPGVHAAIDADGVLHALVEDTAGPGDPARARVVVGGLARVAPGPGAPR